MKSDSGFFAEIRKAIPIIVRASDCEADPRLARMIDILVGLKKLTAEFDFGCMKDACPTHCCKPCSAWTSHAEVYREADLAAMEAAYNGDPVNAFYDPETGCKLPWESRPVNCLVFMCGREHAIERVVFDAAIAQPLKTIRRNIWDYAHAPTREFREKTWKATAEYFHSYPPTFRRNLERLLGVVGKIEEMTRG